MISWFRRPEAHILVLCTANICRSPAAEVLLRDALRQRGLGRRVKVTSAGTEVGAPGATPDPRMVSIAAEGGLAMRRLYATAVTADAIATATLVYVMEPAHREAIEHLLQETGTACELLDPEGVPVEDPYFGSKANVRAVFERLAIIAQQRADEWGQRLFAADRMGRA